MQALLVILLGMLGTLAALAFLLTCLDRSSAWSQPLAFTPLITAPLCYYLYASRDNPRWTELILGTVALGLTVGILASLTLAFLQRHDPTILKTRRDAITISAALIAIPSLLALLIYSSNNPNTISRTFDIAYLISQPKRELPTLAFNDTETQICYFDTAALFHSAKENPATTTTLERASTTGSPPLPLLTLLRDLTEYTIVHCASRYFTSSDFERTLYRRSGRDRLGLPDQQLPTQRITLDQITALRDNPFYGLSGYAATIEQEHAIELPTGMTISIERDDDLTSRLHIQNTFAHITIGTRISIYPRANVAPAPTSLMPRYSAPDTYADFVRSDAPFHVYIAMIYLDATFSKGRYGYPNMRLYEQWANNLFDRIQRQLAWGNPDVRLYQ